MISSEENGSPIHEFTVMHPEDNDSTYQLSCIKNSTGGYIVLELKRCREMDGTSMVPDEKLDGGTFTVESKGGGKKRKSKKRKRRKSKKKKSKTRRRRR